MNKGPQPGKRPNGDERSFIEKAETAWTAKVGDLPEWVRELAIYADAAGLNKAGAAIGYSHSLVSAVLNASYGGKYDRVEECVRGGLMGATVICPRLDEMSRNVCLDWQKKPFAATSSLRVEMYHACRSTTHPCPHSRLLKGGDDDQ